MITEKVMLKSSLQYSDDKKKRYVLSVEWDKDKKKACVIMLSSGQANGIVFDRTTTHCIENLIELDYGGVDIVNLFATIGNGKSVIDDGIDEENLKIITKSASVAEMIVFAVGTGKQNDKSYSVGTWKNTDNLTALAKCYLCIRYKDITKFNEEIEKSKSFKMELQVSHSICTEISQKSIKFKGTRQRSMTRTKFNSY